MEDQKTNIGEEASKKLERTRNRLEINNTLILSIATLSITWCSYQSTLWDGIQTFKLSDANNINRLVQQATLIEGQRQQMDQSIIINFVQAVVEKRKEAIEHCLHGVRPELSKIMSAWLASDPFKNPAAPLHPMAMKEYRDLVKSELTESESLKKKADKYWHDAEVANSNSDNYSLFTVIFSMVMFLGAIATKMTHVKISFALIAISGFICIAILVILLLSMPLAME